MIKEYINYVEKFLSQVVFIFSIFMLTTKPTKPIVLSDTTVVGSTKRVKA